MPWTFCQQGSARWCMYGRLFFAATYDLLFALPQPVLLQPAEYNVRIFTSDIIYHLPAFYGAVVDFAMPFC